MAEAVSWQAGAMSWVSRKASSAASGPLQFADHGAGANDGRRGLDGDVERAEDFRGPVSGFEIDQTGMRGDACIPRRGGRRASGE